MDALYGSTNMCYACLPSLKMPSTPASLGRSSAPQYFTFDPLPAVGERTLTGKNPATKGPRVKKRSRKVLYPPVVKRYFPTEERSFAKRLLFILLAIVFFQVYSADEELPPLTTEQGTATCSAMGETESSHGENPFLEYHPVAVTVPSVESDHGIAWCRREEGPESAVDITHFLEQSPVAF